MMSNTKKNIFKITTKSNYFDTDEHGQMYKLLKKHGNIFDGTSHPYWV